MTQKHLSVKTHNKRLLWFCANTKAWPTSDTCLFLFIQTAKIYCQPPSSIYSLFISLAVFLHVILHSINLTAFNLNNH